MIIGFTGTQQGRNQFQATKFVEIIDHLNPNEFHHGDCIGADEESHFDFIKWHLWKNTEQRKIVIHPPINAQKMARTWMIDDNEKYNDLKVQLSNAPYKLIIETRTPNHYLERNREMVREVEQLIATPKEIEHTMRSGTWATIRYAWHMKKLVHVIPPIDQEN